jgi:NTP pyrophosphatase (non-canonical NTP hydrolase)
MRKSREMMMSYEICMIEYNLVFIVETHETHEVAEHRTYILNEWNKNDRVRYFYRPKPSDRLVSPSIKDLKALGEESMMLPQEYSKEELYDGLVSKFGTDTQMVVATEECSELIKEISKILRMRMTTPARTPSVEYIAEEIADVSIMCEQLTRMFGLGGDVERFKVQKLERIKKLLAE